MSSPLKLVILYDAINHVYAVLGHNLTPEEAEKTVAEYRAKLLNAFSVEQRARHTTTIPDACRACRRDVAHAQGPGGTLRFQEEEQMTAQKLYDAGKAPAPAKERKPWKKRTPVEVVLDQIDKLREGVEAKEEELKQAKRQLQKLEEVRKILEST